LEGAPHTAPEVPPRNPTMSRMNGRVQGISNDLDMDFEPSCLVRTPSGNVYIPSGNLSKSNFSLKKLFSNFMLCTLVFKIFIKMRGENFNIISSISFPPCVYVFLSGMRLVCALIKIHFDMHFKTIVLLIHVYKTFKILLHSRYK
jgi:hypothetical protein